MALSSQSRVWFVLVGLVVLAAGGVTAYLLWPRLPGPGSPRYEEYVREFQVGVAALESPKTPELALVKLNRAIELIPEEPAAWADRAILHLRTNDVQNATKDLKRAQELAPKNGDLETIFAELAMRQGRMSDAVSHLRKAVEARPNDIVLIYKLENALSMESGPDTDAEIQRLMEHVLSLQPNNLRALPKRLKAAYDRGDKAAFGDSLARLDRLAAGWTAKSRDQLGEVHKALETAPAKVSYEITRLDNCLKGERGYQRDTGNVRQEAPIGIAIHRFLRLPQPPPVPSRPDHALTFNVEPWSVARAADVAPSGWNGVFLQWRIREANRDDILGTLADGGPNGPLAREFLPALWLANEKLLQRADVPDKPLPLPAETRGTGAPTPSGVLAIDWNNDLRTDLLIADAGGLRFWQLEPNESMVDVTAKTGLPAAVLNDDYFGAWAADIEMDGDLDIILARRSGAPLVLRNNGDGTFRPLEIKEFADLRDVRAFVWADLDNDGASDAVFLDAAGKLHVFANDRHTHFTAWPMPATLPAILAVTAADVNDDGIFDLVALQQDGGLLRISDIDHRVSWQVADLARGTPIEDGKVGTVNLFAADMDNNGALDLIIAGPKSAQIFLADDQFRFSPLPASVPLQVFAVLDLDDDGRLDLLGLSSKGELRQARNNGAIKYQWQLLRPMANPKGVGDNRNNSFAIGGEVEIRAGRLVQKQRITGPMVHCGLGEQTAIDVARIVWPSGEPQWEFEFAPPAQWLALVMAQRLNGSCPFLFTYDGAGMRFAGDCLWNTPLGMYVNGQNVDSFAQTTEWLKVRGEHLVPKNGYYDVRVHANLWETDYFDQVGLLVVDHPPGTEIHVDERFFLTPTPPRLYVTTPTRPVARAWDHLCNDVTDIIAAVDGRYLDHAGRGRYQGITSDHWVEVDLGDNAPSDGPVYLIARGWTHPTDSSINVAIAQGKHDMPRPLVLEVPDGKGGWKVGRPALGFPAGKDKTILIRLDGVDGPGVSRRFRLRTNMEIFWDFLGYARGLDESVARVQRPTPKSAELRFRGMLEMSQKDASSPEVPHYDKVMPGRQLWRDLTGYYTRHGDVRELLEKPDDRYVIMNAGGEIALEYPVPGDPPAGWKRDFIFECDGWTRDGNANTRFGTTVLPLPAHGLKSLDRPPGRLEDDPVYRRFPEDWVHYHTRYVTTDDFERGLRTFRR
jgi:Tfp pilus assembly protein PilF